MSEEFNLSGFGQISCLSNERVKEAALFGKRHDSVLRDVRELDCSEGFHLHNFVEISYRDSMNRKQKAYTMTRNGFMYLAMGYRGARAAARVSSLSAGIISRSLAARNQRRNAKVRTNAEPTAVGKCAARPAGPQIAS